MLFTSISYLFFLPSVFLIYWIFRNNYKWQNSILFLASYYFYSCWDYRFVILLLISTIVDFYAGLKISQSGTRKQKKKWMLLSIILNLHIPRKVSV
jgi:alginate O-acetyltransferase complex protein AlgI